MLYVYDKKTARGNFDNNGLAVLDECLIAEINQELNGDYSLEIEYPVVSKKTQYLEELNIIKADGQLFRIYKVERTQDKISKVRVWARHIFYDLAFYFIESSKILNANMKEALEGTMPPELQGLFLFKALEENIAPFAVKEVNAVNAIFRLIEIYGGELFRDNFNIEIKESIGENNGILIKYGKNIKGMKVIEDTSELATRIYAVGANNLLLPERYIEVQGERAKLLPYPITKKVEFKECKDVESLRAKAIEASEQVSTPKIFITIDFMELSKTEEYKNYSHLTKVGVGDFVKVRNEKIAVTTDLRVIKKKTDLINPINTKIELGDPLNTIIEKLDTSKLLEEINNAISGTLSSVIIKKNADIFTITQSSYPAMIIGITTKADTNLNCNITMTGKASEDCTLTILFSLDGKYYDFKPIQKLATGDNVIGLPLPMPQVTAGNHTFMVELKVSNGNFTIQKNNLQVSIEGRDLEGGLSASIPRAEVVYTFLYNLFNKSQELIDKRKKQIEQLDELVKSRFIEMFGDPAKNNKSWQVDEIGNFLNVLTDYHSNGSYESLRDNVTLLDTPNYALMVRTTDLENNNFEKDVKYIDEHAYNHLEKSKIFGGEIIINKIGSAGKVYLMPFLNRPVSLAMNQFLLRFDEDKVNHIYIYNLLLTSYMEAKIKEKVRGAVTKTITKDAIREIKIMVPPINIQNEFVDFIRQVDKLKFEMEKSLKELEDNFSSLMQKAFKGELF